MTNTPKPQANTLDEILESFGASVSPVATLKGVRNPLVKPENTAQAKQAIQALITEARIDELKNLLPTYEAYTLENETELKILTRLVAMGAIRPELADLEGYKK